jgi:hypothetical protein
LYCQNNKDGEKNQKADWKDAPSFTLIKGWKFMLEPRYQLSEDKHVRKEENRERNDWVNVSDLKPYP